MANPIDFILTKHAIERLCERCTEFTKYSNLFSDSALKRKAAYEFLANTSEEKGFLNNSTFMTMLGEKYGFENRYTMFVKEDMVFVGVSNKRGNFIVTVLTKSGHYLKHVRGPVKKTFVKKVAPVLHESELKSFQHRSGSIKRRYGK